MIFNWIDQFIKGYQIPQDYDFHIENMKGQNYSLLSLCSQLSQKIENLESRIIKLEEENIGLTNSLYEVENSLQAKIDSIHPVIYNLKNYKLDKSDF